MVFTVCKKDNAAQLHVDAGCKECWGQKDEKGLDDKWSNCPMMWCFSGRNRASDISYPFNCGKSELACKIRTDFESTSKKMDLQQTPITNGMKYHVLVRINW